MLIRERIKIIVEKEIERLYDKAVNPVAPFIGLSEEDVKELKALHEIANLQGFDQEDPARPYEGVDTQKLLDTLKKQQDKEREGIAQWMPGGQLDTNG